MNYEIIDFHTHPYLQERDSICYYKDVCKMSTTQAKEYLQGLGIRKICGSVILSAGEDVSWQTIQAMNDEALKVKELYGEFYEVGFHIHAGYVEQSIQEIRRMRALGIRLVGELVPYTHGWNYGSEGFEKILKELDGKDMVVSFHSTYAAEGNEKQIDEMVAKHPTITFVAAHPGEKNSYLRHIERMKRFPNYYLDLSGTGLFRFGMLGYGVSEVGSERFLMGSDFSVCDPSMYVSAITTDPFLTETDKRNILCDNAKRILKL